MILLLTTIAGRQKPRFIHDTDSSFFVTMVTVPRDVDVDVEVGHVVQRYDTAEQVVDAGRFASGFHCAQVTCSASHSVTLHCPLLFSIEVFLLPEAIV